MVQLGYDRQTKCRTKRQTKVTAQDQTKEMKSWTREERHESGQDDDLIELFATQDRLKFSQKEKRAATRKNWEPKSWPRKNENSNNKKSCAKLEVNVLLRSEWIGSGLKNANLRFLNKTCSFGEEMTFLMFGFGGALLEMAKARFNSSVPAKGFTFVVSRLNIFGFCSEPV